MIVTDKISQIFTTATNQNPLWQFDISGETSFRIERFNGYSQERQLKALERPVIVMHFGGKEVSSEHADYKLTSFPGMATILPSGISTCWNVTGPVDYALITLNGRALSKLDLSLRHHETPVSVRNSLVGALITELANYLIQSKNQDDEHIQALANALVSQICSELNQSEGLNLIKSGSGQFNYVQQAISYIESNLALPLLAEDIASYLGIHPSYFRRLFRSSTNTPLHRYITEKRLTRAMELLTGSDLTLSQIAEEVGFGSQSHMTSSFRKYTDSTPAAIRRAAHC